MKAEVSGRYLRHTVVSHGRVFGNRIDALTVAKVHESMTLKVPDRLGNSGVFERPDGSGCRAGMRRPTAAKRATCH